MTSLLLAAALAIAFWGYGSFWVPPSLFRLAGG